MGYRYRFKFNLKNAWKVEPVYDKGKVAGYKACWNGMMSWKEDRLRTQYNKLSDNAKSLGKYLAIYRDKSLTIKGDEFYEQQITMLEGMKARKAKAAKLLKKIKVLRRMEPSVQAVMKGVNKTAPIGIIAGDWRSIAKASDIAAKLLSERLDTFEPFVSKANG